MVVLACFENAIVAGTKSDHTSWIDRQHCYSVNTSLVSSLIELILNDNIEFCL